LPLATATYYGQRLKGHWWGPTLWKRREKELKPIVVKLLEPLRRLIQAVEKELKEAPVCSGLTRSGEFNSELPSTLQTGGGHTAEDLFGS
jgi:hypothetical protein